MFHRTGVRFVRCRACGLVYADPIDPGARKYFDIESLGQHDRAIDRRHAVADFRDLLTTVVDDYTRRMGRAPSKVLVVGRWMRDFTTVLPGVEVTLAVDLCGDEGKLANQPLTESIGAALGDFDIVLLHELLEATSNPITVLDGLAAAMAPDATLTVAFANMKALANRVLRRSWRRFFDRKVSYYDADNLEVLLASAGFRRLGQESVRTRYSLGYVGARLDLHPAFRWVLRVTGSSLASVSVAAGDEVASFVPFAPGAVELLSIIVPVYNEELYLRQVLDALLEKELPIDKEVIIVESASTDSSREIVRSFERQPGVRVLYQERRTRKGQRGSGGARTRAGNDRPHPGRRLRVRPRRLRRAVGADRAAAFELRARFPEPRHRQLEGSAVRDLAGEVLPHELRAARVRPHLQRAVPAEGH